MKKEVMRKYISAIISLGTLLILFYTIIDLKQQVKQIDVLQFKLDSVIVRADILYDQKYNIEMQNSRYEATIAHLEKVNPKLALEFINFMNHEME
jgi:hypothetical protein